MQLCLHALDTSRKSTGFMLQVLHVSQQIQQMAIKHCLGIVECQCQGQTRRQSRTQQASVLQHLFAYHCFEIIFSSKVAKLQIQQVAREHSYLHTYIHIYMSAKRNTLKMYR